MPFVNDVKDNHTGQGASTPTHSPSAADEATGIAVSVVFQKSQPSPAPSFPQAEVIGGGVDGYDVVAEELPEHPISFKKIYYYKDDKGNSRPFHVVKQLNKKDALEARKQFHDLRIRYPDMKSFDLQNLVMSMENGTKLDVSENDPAIKALRNLFEEADYEKGFTRHRWPSYREHGRGDMGAKPCLVVPSEKAAKLANKKLEEILEHPAVKNKLDGMPQQEVRMKELDHFVSELQKKLKEMVEVQKKHADGETNLEKKDEEEQVLRNLNEMQSLFSTCERFPLYMAMLFEGNDKMEENIAFLKELFKGEESSLQSYLSDAIFGKKDPELTTAEKDYSRDIALLSTKNKSEYHAASRALKHSIKRDPIAWPILHGFCQKNVDAICKHPLIQGTHLTSDRLNEFREFIADFFSKT